MVRAGRERATVNVLTTDARPPRSYSEIVRAADGNATIV
jgi:hypothetical protein